MSIENSTQKITPNLWFDNQAEEAANFYTAIFNDSQILEASHYTDAGKDVHGQPEGRVMTVEFEIVGQKFTALNGGPLFKFTPSVSFFASCGSEEKLTSFGINYRMADRSLYRFKNIRLANDMVGRRISTAFHGK